MTSRRKKSPPPPARRPERRPADERGDQFDAWFPRIQRVVVLALGGSGLVYAAVLKDIGLASVFGGFVLWQGYTEARRKGNGG